MIRVDLVVDEETSPRKLLATTSSSSWMVAGTSTEEAILKNEKLVVFFFIYFLYRIHIYNDFSCGWLSPYHIYKINGIRPINIVNTVLFLYTEVSYKIYGPTSLWVFRILEIQKYQIIQKNLQELYIYIFKIKIWTNEINKNN